MTAPGKATPLHSTIIIIKIFNSALGSLDPEGWKKNKKAGRLNVVVTSKRLVLQDGVESLQSDRVVERENGPYCYYAPPLIGGGIKRCFCLSVWRLTCVWRISVAYIGPNWRTERPRKTEIGTEVAHATRD